MISGLRVAQPKENSKYFSPPLRTPPVLLLQCGPIYSSHSVHKKLKKTPVQNPVWYIFSKMAIKKYNRWEVTMLQYILSARIRFLFFLLKRERVKWPSPPHRIIPWFYFVQILDDVVDVRENRRPVSRVLYVSCAYSLYRFIIWLITLKFRKQRPSLLPDLAGLSTLFLTTCPPIHL